MRNFATSIITPFNGKAFGQPITSHMKSNTNPQGASLNIDWAAYALQLPIPNGVTVFNAGISIDLSRQVIVGSMDILKSVFIDNTAVDTTVYLRCEDTGQIITCPDSAYGWFPLITNGQQFTLFCANIIPAKTGKQKTTLIFSNASFDTFSGGEYNRTQALYRASGASNYTSPIIGDKLAYVALDLLYAIGNQNYSSVIIPAVPNSQIVITAINISDALGNSSGALTPITLTLLNNSIPFFSVKDNANSSNIAFHPGLANLNLQLAIDGTKDTVLTITNDQANNQIRGALNFQMSYAQIILPALS